MNVRMTEFLFQAHWLVSPPPPPLPFLKKVNDYLATRSSQKIVAKIIEILELLQ